MGNHCYDCANVKGSLMSAAAPPPATPPALAAGTESNDPLGYDAYAKTLWTRIDHALNRDATTESSETIRW